MAHDPDGGLVLVYPGSKSWDKASGKTGTGKKFHHSVISGANFTVQPCHVDCVVFGPGACWATARSPLLSRRLLVERMFEESNSGQVIVGNGGSAVLIGQVAIQWWRFDRDNWRNQWSEHENTARVAQQSVPIAIETHRSSFQGVLSAPRSALSRMKRCHLAHDTLPDRLCSQLSQSWCTHLITLPSHTRWLKTDFENKSCDRRTS